jgi:CRISPR-associated protein Cas5d
MKPYPLQLEISGPIALWARPDTLPNPVSYVAPPFNAVKGIFEAILRWKSVMGGAGDPPNGTAEAHESTRRVAGSNRRVACATHAFNYGGPLRKGDQRTKGTSLQIFAQVLINVCYRLQRSSDWQSAVARICNPHPSRRCEAVGLLDALPTAIRRYSRSKARATPKPHAYVDTYRRRLERGRWFYAPCLGWKELVPDYPDSESGFRHTTAPCATAHHVIPAFLEMVFDRTADFSQN